MRELTYAQAGLEAVAEEMRRDPTIFYMSTDPALSLMQEFGTKRVRPTPIAEGALTAEHVMDLGCLVDDLVHGDE